MFFKVKINASKSVKDTPFLLKGLRLDSTMNKVFAFYEANPNLISGILYGLQFLQLHLLWFLNVKPEVIPEYHHIGPQNNIKGTNWKIY